ncbi:MAG: excalibur calcium-binding domain-containing protein [Galactobacter sp.]
MPGLLRLSGLACLLGVAPAVTGCGADGAAGSEEHSPSVASVESVKDRLGQSCDDDTMGVAQGDVTIWCDPESGVSAPFVWVDAKGHDAAERAKAKAAAEERAAKRAEAEKKAAEKKAAEKKAAADKAAKDKAAKQAAADKAARERAAQEQAAKEAAERKAEAERQATQQQQQQNTDVYYKNCTAVREAGAAPIHQGEPGYARHLDRDGDGVGCE